MAFSSPLSFHFSERRWLSRPWGVEVIESFRRFEQTTKLGERACPIGVICRGRNSYDRPSESALGLLTGHKPDSPEQKTGGRKGPEKSQ